MAGVLLDNLPSRHRPPEPPLFIFSRVTISGAFRSVPAVRAEKIKPRKEEASPLQNDNISRSQPPNPGSLLASSSHLVQRGGVPNLESIWSDLKLQCTGASWGGKGKTLCICSSFVLHSMVGQHRILSFNKPWTPHSAFSARESPQETWSSLYYSTNSAG